MTKTKYFALALSLILMVMTSCREQEVALSIDEQQCVDSLALHVAVMPVEDCLPLYLIEALALDDSCGLDLRLWRHSALMDIDTTYERSHVLLAYEDSIRLSHYSGGDTLWRRMPGRLLLVANRLKKVTDFKKLFERMIAVERWSKTDSFVSIIVEQSGLENSDVYRPQVNDVKLRYRMLQDGLVDCAILPQPYAGWANKQGHRILANSDSLYLGMGFYLKTDTLDDYRRRQLHVLDSLYDQAKEMLNHINLDSLDVFSL